MAYSFDVVGWQDWNNDRWISEEDVLRDEKNRVADFDQDAYPLAKLPDDPGEVHGAFVHIYDPQNPEDQDFMWIYTRGKYQDWAEWYVYIGAIIELDYGLSLAE